MFLASKTNKPFCTWLGLPIMRWKISSHHWTPFHPKTKSNFRERYWMFPRHLAQDKLFFLHKKLGPVFWTGCFYSYSIPSSGQVFHLPKDTYLILPSRQNTSHLHKSCFKNGWTCLPSWDADHNPVSGANSIAPCYETAVPWYQDWILAVSPWLKVKGGHAEDGFCRLGRGRWSGRLAGLWACLHLDGTAWSSRSAIAMWCQAGQCVGGPEAVDCRLQRQMVLLRVGLGWILGQCVDEGSHTVVGDQAPCKHAFIIHEHTHIYLDIKTHAHVHKNNNTSTYMKTNTHIYTSKHAHTYTYIKANTHT